MKIFYLFCALLGAILPYLFFVQHFAAEGLGLRQFYQALFANPAAGGCTVDLLFSSVVFWIFIFLQKGRSKGPQPYLFIVLNLLIGLSCALPAYLYARERGAG